MKFSIVVPSFNQGQYLEEALLSIINQRYPELELIVVDGGSTDNSIEIIKKYESHITWWVSEKDRGQSHALNKGFDRVTGDIVSWLCSDDYYLPGAFHQAAKYFNEAPASTGLIHGGTRVLRNENVISTDWGYTNPCIERYISGMAFSQPSAFFKKIYFDRAGGYVSEHLNYGMDYDLFCRLACVCDFLPVKDVFSCYRLHEESKSISAHDNFVDDWNKVFVNFCKNTGWDEVIDEMKKTDLFDESIFSIHESYSSIAGNERIKNTDKKRTLFYHYCYTLRAWYRSGYFNKARKLGKLIMKDYPEEWFRNEFGVHQILQRLRMPGPMLSILRKIKRQLK